MKALPGLRERLDAVPLVEVEGRLIEAVGPILRAHLPGARIGAMARVAGRRCEVIGLSGDEVTLLPIDGVSGLPSGAVVRLDHGSLRVPVGDDLIGRIVDGLGVPLDDGPPLKGARVSVDARPPDALSRPPIADHLVTGVRVVDGLLSIGRGQRMSIMSGSGVGKSTLLGMLARRVEADVNVICLVGERGREVREFIGDVLGPEGLARSVVVVATGDRAPALQVRAPFTATAIAEAFRARGRHVLLMMDSLTRLALAQRQIGLAAGEPPATRGYPPSVFSMLPGLLERAGTHASGGTITGIYTVLVEGDDVNDPIGDAVRGIVDGHIVLSRKLASYGHYPAVDVLGSVSRVMHRVVGSQHQQDAAAVRELMATWAENEELVRLGAYRPGTSAEVDKAMRMAPAIRTFLRQGALEDAPLAQTTDALRFLAQ